MWHDPTIQVEGGGAFRYPVPQNNMMTRGDVRKNINNHRYGGPVQTPSRGTGVFKHECVEMEQRLRTTAAEGPTPRSGTVLQTGWHKAENHDRCVNQVRLPSAGAKMTNPDYPMMLQNPRNTVGKGQRPLNRCDKGVQTPSHWAEGGKPDSVDINRGMMTTLAEVCVSWHDKVKPSRYHKTAVAAVETDANGTKEIKDQLMDSDRHRTATQAIQMSCSRVAKPISGPVRPVVPKMDPRNGTYTMHYEWIVRESVRSTEILTTDNYLEVPVLKLPRRFLHLAAEARTVEITNDKLCCLSDVQPQGIGLPKPVLVTVMMDSPVRKCKLKDRVDRGVSPDTTEQPLLLGLNTDERKTAPIDMGDSDANSAKHSKPVDRLGPVDPLNMTEQPASLGLRMDWTGDIPVYQEGSMTFWAGQDEPANRLRPGGPQNISDQPVVIGLVPNDKGKISTGPVDYDLAVANQMEKAGYICPRAHNGPR